MFLTATRLMKLRVLWFAAFIILSIWYLYWICYDLIVWSKALTQVPLYHYAGLTVSIAFILLGTQIGRIRLTKKPTLSIRQGEQKRRIQQTQQAQQVQKIPEQQAQPIEHEQQIQPVKEKENPGSAECNFYLGYLHERPKSVEIPQECLTCMNVVNCLSRGTRDTTEPNQEK